MKQNYFRLRLVSLFVALSFSVAAQKNFWTDISASKIVVNQDQRRILPEKYRTILLDTAGLLSFLETAPNEFTQLAKSNPVVVMLPMPDGTYKRFSIVKTFMMEPGLAIQFPGIKTYGGQGIDDPYATLKLDWSALGFHAMINSPLTGSVFIDPYANGLMLDYISYNKSDFKQTGSFMEDGEIIKNNKAGKSNLQQRTEAGQCVGGTLRSYRLAVACTGEYARAVGFGNNVTAAQALSAIVTTVNRVNGVYETELSIRLSLVSNNINIVFTNPSSDPFGGNNNAGNLIDESQEVIDSIIKPANYDIGHTFSAPSGGSSGLAQQGVVCENGFKASGVTGQTSPVGDPYDIDFVSHEIGHQFGGSHTFNAATGSCSGNGVNSTNAEPGSGSTIMAYAGICGSSNDLQPNSDPYFHALSLNELTDYTINGNGNSCAVQIVTGNTPPVVTAGNNYAIPKSTPFILSGSAGDADGDALTYSWEQINVGGPFDDWNSPSGNAPIFRSFEPVSTPERYFPKLSDIINNTTTIGELLPTYTRTLNFRLTARDNRAGGGGVCFDESSVSVRGDAGPFLVTEPNTPVTWNVGTFRYIRWDVANTNTAPVNCTSVAIQLSVDGGISFPFTIIDSTPNDGVAEIVVPNNITSSARIRVIALNNIFFDLSNKDFVIQASQETGFAFSNPEPVTVCNNSVPGTVISTSSLNNYSTPITLSATGNPAGSTVVFTSNPINPGSSDSVRLQGNIPSGVYNITITGTSGSVVKTRIIEFVIGTLTQAPAGSTPSNNSIGEPLIVTFDWLGVANAESYDLQISTSPTFSPLAQNITDITTTSFTLTTPLITDTEYYWRVLANNACGKGPLSSALRFKTAGINCADTVFSTNVPVNIPTTVATRNSTLNIPAGGIIADVNVAGLRGQHSYVGDLTVSLISPAGTTIVLFDEVCGQRQNFNINFDDEASSANIPCPPTNGATRRPAEPLSAFDNENSTGTWTLRISDNSDEDGGSLDNWGLRICTYTATTLPVNWLSFTGQKNENYTATLLWSTSNELNNDHYEIERSADGNQFSLLGTVAAGQEPGAAQQYIFTDARPRSGINYYRLKQVDLDGRFTYSKIVRIVFDKTGEQYIVYPNPAVDESTVRIITDLKQVTLRLLDALGQVVYQQNLETANAGQEISLPVKRLSKGLYILSVTTEKGTSSKKIIVK